MRVRDTKLYILLTALVFLMVITFNIFYISSFTNRARELTYSDTINDTKSNLIDVSEKIVFYKHKFESANYTDVELINDHIDNYEQYFDYPSNGSISKTALLNAIVIETANAIDKYYLYISYEDKLGRVELAKLFEPISLEGIYLFKGTTGEYVYSNLSYDHFFSYINPDGSADYSDIVASVEAKDNFSDIVYINGEKRIVSGINFGKDFYFCQFFPLDAYNARIKGIVVMGIILSAVMALGMCLIILASILAVHKQNKLILVSRRSARRSDAIIIRASRTGRIIENYHNIPDLIGKTYKSIFDFKTNTGESLKDEIKHYDNLIVTFDGKESTRYIDFTIFKYNYTYYLIGRDVTDSYLNNERLKDLTSKNAVTGLPNYFSLVADYSKIKQQSLNRVISFMLIDLVEHEEISSVFGTTTYNAILNEVANRIAKNVGNDNIYHVENNLFLVVLNSNIKEENAKRIESLINNLQQTIDIKNNTLYVKYKYSSYDVVNVSKTNVSLDDIIDSLKTTLDVAIKSINRDYIKYDATIQNMINHRMQMQMDLINALENNEFMMYFQPQYDVLENRIAGFESLIRWNNPKYINISPQEYIEFAEKNGLIIEIGNFIVKDVFKTAKLFEPYGISLSINVSPAQLFQAGFVGLLLEEFEKNELKPGSIAVEITETFLMENFSVVIEKLNILRNHGFRIHLDDFGTGYSSLQYLKELPIDTIKTDKEFIKNLENDKTSQLIIKGIIGMAKSINLSVISEGVETKGQAEILRRAGTNYFQGWLISKAVPLDKALDMAKNGVDIDKKGK